MQLIDVKLENHEIFRSTFFNLSKPNSLSANYKTVLIGPNGTGKSTILSVIADALITETSLNKKKALKKISYNYEISVGYNNNKLKISKNALSSHSLEIGKVLAITSNLNDRFPFVLKHNDQSKVIYEYLGTRTASNNIFFSNTKEKLIENILRVCASKRRVESVLNVLDSLKFSSKFSISLSKGRNYNEFTNFCFGEMDYATPTSKVSNFSEKGFIDLINSIWLETYFEEIKELLYINPNSIGKNITINIDLNDEHERDRFTLDYQLLKRLIEAKILTVSDLSLFSMEGYDVYRASSGEFNILRTFVAIISRVEDNSIILIDEPEISLHPNWQIEFISLLDKSLSYFIGCHTIIATHSHFILSNLNAADSTIIGLYPSTESRHVYIQELDVNSYGWSPEHILYRVFGVTGYRNKYFEMDLRCIVDNICNNVGTDDQFIEAVKRISEYNIESNDLLFDIINKAKIKVYQLELH